MSGFDNGIIQLDAEAAELVGEILTDAATDGATVRVAIDDGGLKLSVDRGTWTPPIGMLFGRPR